MQITEGSPHPISLGKGVDDDWQPHGGHHAQVGEGKVHHEHVGRSSKGFDLEKNVANTPVTKEVDGPEEEEADANNMVDQRMLGRKLAPVFVNNLQGFFVHTIKVGGSYSSFIRRQTLLLNFNLALRIYQVIMGIHVDALVWSPRHLDVKTRRLLLQEHKQLLIDKLQSYCHC